MRTEPVPDLIRESAIHDPAGEKAWVPGAETPDLIRGRDDREEWEITETPINKHQPENDLNISDLIKKTAFYAYPACVSSYLINSFITRHNQRIRMACGRHALPRTVQDRRKKAADCLATACGLNGIERLAFGPAQAGSEAASPVLAF